MVMDITSRVNIKINFTKSVSFENIMGDVEVIGFANVSTKNIGGIVRIKKSSYL